MPIHPSLRGSRDTRVVSQRVVNNARLTDSRWNRLLVVALALPLALIAVALLQHERVIALDGTSPPVSVTVTPTDDLVDGQEITISATMNDGATLTEIRAHICDPAIPTLNLFNFSYQADYCAHSSAVKRVSGGLGLGDYESSTVFGNTTSGSITFKAGLGTVTWDDELLGFPDPALPDRHTLTCDPEHACDLVVRFQDSAGTHYFRAPLTYSNEPPTTTTTTAPPTTTTTTAPASTTTTVAQGPIGINIAQGPVGGSFTVTSESWESDTPVEVTFNSTPIVLGSLVPDADGVVQGSFVVPSVEPGAHTVKLAGTSAGGEPQVFSIGFTVTATSTPPGGGSTTTPTGGTTTTVTGPLAFTGASSRDLASLGVLLLAVGVHLLAVRRRRFVSS